MMSNFTMRLSFSPKRMARQLLGIAGILLMAGGPVFAQRAQDFGYRSVPAEGVRPVLVILLEFPDTPFTRSHTPRYFDEMLFGPAHPNVAGYFAVVSRQKLRLTKAAMISLRYDKSLADVQAQDARAEKSGSDELRRWVVQKASTQGGFDYSRYAPPRGTVTSKDLVIVLITSHPLNQDRGQTSSIRLRVPRSPRYREVEVDAQLSGFGQASSLMTAAHEMSHQMLDHFDIYAAGNAQMTLAGSTVFGRPDDWRTFHLDAWHKMRAGWIEPRVFRMDRPGGPVVMSAPAGGEAIPTEGQRPVILYDPRRGTSEFFVIEYRARSRLPVNAADPQKWYEVNYGLPFAGYDADVSAVEAGNNPRAGERGVLIWYVKLASLAMPVQINPPDGYWLMYALGAPNQGRGGQALWRGGNVPIRLRWPNEPGLGDGTGGTDTGVALWVGNSEPSTLPAGGYVAPAGTTLEWVVGDAFTQSQPVLRKVNPSVVVRGRVVALEGRFPPTQGEYVPQLTRSGSATSAVVQRWTPTQITVQIPATASAGRYEIRLADAAARRQSAALPIEIATGTLSANPTIVAPAPAARSGAGSPAAARGPFYAVIRDAPYYSASPMQGRPPDGTVRAGARVRLTDEKIGAYTRIELPDGRLAYVENKALQRAK